jgi:uncharacterized membrane protein YphA (DoxX/SURF4 family)
VRPISEYGSDRKAERNSFMNKLMFSLFQTSRAVGPLLLRVFLAVVMFPHGAQKVVGWFGGSGLNWLGKQKGEGIEFDVLLWAIALALIIQGAGAYSLDRVISAKFQTAKTND